MCLDLHLGLGGDSAVGLRRCFFCGSFLLVMLHFGVCCNVVSVHCSLVVTCSERADLLAVVCVV